MKKIGIVGCTGAVGFTMLELLTEHNNYEILCMASKKSAGKEIVINNNSYTIFEFSVDLCKQCDVIFLCVSGEFSKQYAPQLAKFTYVIDNSSAFRYNDDVPLLVPPINAHHYNNEKLIANPNCSSAVALMVLGPLHQNFEIESLIISTYQAASGAGNPAMLELKDKAHSFEDYGIDNTSNYFAYNLAFNVIPQVDKFEDNLYTKEEMKIVWEIRKVLNEPNLAISATAVRVPTLRSHAESLTIKFRKVLPALEDIKTLLSNSSGVEVVDNPSKYLYPMPMTSTYKHAVEVGRIRYNLIYDQYGLDMFVSGDQLLRGAALNAYEIMQLIK
jgi:aspartate-semialdehyde dehydrogenase